MSEYSMPSYFQNMPVIGKDLSAFHEDNAAEIQAVEQEIHEIREAALEAGKSTEALNESGQWTAMQRIMELVDEGTWCPLNSLYNPRQRWHRQGPRPHRRQMGRHHRERQQEARRRMGSRSGRQSAARQRHGQAPAHPPRVRAELLRR